MDTSRLNHIAGLIARKGSGGKLTGTEQQELEERIPSRLLYFPKISE